MQDLTALRADTEKKRDTLTALRIKVSEGPTVSNVHGLGETIDTMDYVTRIGDSSRALVVIVDFATTHPGFDSFAEFCAGSQLF